MNNQSQPSKTKHIVSIHRVLSLSLSLSPYLNVRLISYAWPKLMLATRQRLARPRYSNQRRGATVDTMQAVPRCASTMLRAAVAEHIGHCLCSSLHLAHTTHYGHNITVSCFVLPSAGTRHQNCNRRRRSCSFRMRC